MKQLLMTATAVVVLIGGATSFATAQAARTTANMQTTETEKIRIETAPYENYIQVNGNAEKEIVPDQIYVSITLNENDTKGKISVEKLESDMIAKLKSIGVNIEKDLTIGAMDSDWKKRFLKSTQARTTATYQLIVDSGAMLGKVYQALNDIGISNLSVIKTNHTKIKEYQNEVRIEAMKDAQAIAQTLAQAVGQQAGRAIHIADYNSGVRYGALSDNVMMLRSGAAKEEYYESPLDFMKIKITYSLSAKFELK